MNTRTCYLPMVGKVEKLDQAPVRAERLPGSVFQQHYPLTGTFGVCGMMTSAARPRSRSGAGCPANVAMRA
jgi:hypothetical protein